MSIRKEILDAAKEVHREIGAGQTEKNYHNALEIELSIRGITFTSEGKIPISYKGRMIGYARPDMIVRGSNDIVVVELKADSNPSSSTPVEQTQRYKQSMLMDDDLEDPKVALILGFNSSLEYEVI